MVSVEEASNIIFSNLCSPQIEVVSLPEAIGRILAEPIKADRDLPPFNRVTMDGIAINYESWLTGSGEFNIEDVQAAGTPKKSLLEKNNCIEVMTGAVLPEGTDVVIRYEDVTIKNEYARVDTEEIFKGQNIHRQGSDAKKNKILLNQGILISPSEIALMASVGKHKVKVYKFPNAAVVSTGDELVAIDAIPLDHEIRRSNSYALIAAMQELKWQGMAYHLHDEKETLISNLKAIIESHDVIILSGGVSKGKYDYIPEVLQTLGIKKLFHTVKQRPGKPFWFGVSSAGKVIFALPGNPVSTYLCFYKYIRPWVLRSVGHALETLQAVLETDFTFEANLTYFLQVKTKIENGRLIAKPDTGGGSGDFVNLKNVSGFLELPYGKEQFKAGEIFTYIPFRHL